MGASLGYKALQGILRATGFRHRMPKDAARGRQRNMRPRGRQAERWARSEFDGRAVWTCHPPGGATDRIYVHEHGGGYVYGLQSIHYRALQELADHAGMTVVVPDYPLPPQARAPEIMGWADRHFAAVVEHHGVETVALGGCSAGGNLALAILQRRAARDEANPGTVILWSPWVDLTEAEAPPTKADDYEALITPFGLEPAVGAYLGESGVDRSDPHVSPLCADLSDLPTMHIVTGQKDILHPSIAAFAEKADAAGKLGDYLVEPDYGHYWMFYPVKDRHPTLRRIADWLG
ncbi:alpha/beta hydrolase [uncultured Algimonas sp.]|uniref:alpha/beta hydrolase fold domain-containing protein n=1 Tax=uncultured Algimonas sp. TaxID=1547920 RepID=UPI00261E697A|nr:alpha/beta hydrolase [uncultured Algimonas sp.]